MPVLDTHITRIRQQVSYCFAADQNIRDHDIFLQDLFTPVMKATRQTKEVNDSVASARPVSPTVSIVSNSVVYALFVPLSVVIYVLLVMMSSWQRSIQDFSNDVGGETIEDGMTY